MGNIVYVLNADYSFLGTISVRKAIRLVVKEKAEIVKDTGKQIYRDMLEPFVIRILKLVRQVYKNKVPYSPKNVMMRDNFTCAYCGLKFKNSKDHMISSDGKRVFLNIDHIQPRAQGGKTSWENCISSCNICNTKKGSRTPSEAEMSFVKGMRAFSPTINEHLMTMKKHLKVYDIIRSVFEQ